MKAHIKIPDGWRRLRAGETARVGDMFLCGCIKWELVCKRSYEITESNTIHIRKKRKL